MFCFFNWHNLKQKQTHQMASSRAKTRSTRSQTCVKYRGIVIFIKRNSDVKTGDLQKIYKKYQNKVNFVLFTFLKMLFVLPQKLCMTGDLWPRLFIWHQDIRLLIVSAVLWVLSSGNNLSVTHSDTALYVFYVHLVIFTLVFKFIHLLHPLFFPQPAVLNWDN